jgi:hypothetical protein
VQISENEIPLKESERYHKNMTLEEKVRQNNRNQETLLSKGYNRRKINMDRGSSKK